MGISFKACEPVRCLLGNPITVLLFTLVSFTYLQEYNPYVGDIKDLSESTVDGMIMSLFADKLEH